jgi:cytochrome oxidase Cu insertion factor (SCO1/SenC/PrrC family)
MKRANVHRSFLVVSLALVVLTGCLGGQDYEFEGGELNPPAAAAPIDLTDQYGESFSLDDLEGDVALVYFGYTT